MDIEKLIEREAPKAGKFDTHDDAYAKALRDCYRFYSQQAKTLNDLLEYQKVARENYDSTHYTTAACVVLLELIEEIKNEH